MARKASSHPTELELAILRIIWRDGPSTVRHVCDTLAPYRPLAFTTVLTIVNIMVKKGYLEARSRSRAEGGAIYNAKVAESRTAFAMLSSLALRLFGGSIASAMQHLVRAGEIDAHELQDLRKMVNQQPDDKHE